MYDVIVVGARAGQPPQCCSPGRGPGLPLDKAGFPSDTLSAHYIHSPASPSFTVGAYWTGRGIGLPANRRRQGLQIRLVIWHLPTVAVTDL